MKKLLCLVLVLLLLCGCRLRAHPDFAEMAQKCDRIEVCVSFGCTLGETVELSTEDTRATALLTAFNQTLDISKTFYGSHALCGGGPWIVRGYAGEQELFGFELLASADGWILGYDTGPDGFRPNQEGVGYWFHLDPKYNTNPPEVLKELARCYDALIPVQEKLPEYSPEQYLFE